MSQDFDIREPQSGKVGRAGAGLHEFVLHLQDLVLASSDVREFLAATAAIFATQLSQPGNHLSCGITVVRQKRPVAVASSDTLARNLDELQNSIGHGPCLTALRTKSMVHVPDLDADVRWPKYNQEARKTGIGSILAVPMHLQAPSQAVVNLYSPNTDGFPHHGMDAAVGLTGIAAKALDLALNIAQLRDARDDLAAALKSRTVIDTAIGVIMAQSRCSRDAAFQILVNASSHRNMKLKEVAAGIISGIAGERVFPTTYDE
ncbi:GAF and ANTAR domain-containing protein [Pseudarthrobacter raffinosi]|uniref:GAF and ANTAR domain-containing protein n=1 Tax=Pseudarthrobacter raffinosi TaxID=2953651 RepID=UPI00208E5CD5|nr:MULTISPECIES: GAF and ANTAR domain-containing protein [unclassified Pseudarthrobacter]MCO4238867.1 GAF and ANTAR domain-containing protein [Pseudarthrobacter sp. MDT3-28]MCO4251339.1 GAF and ANTAR domain-containing protein [Pseudarthrobacter sp. MDT3-9]MCO4264823.1 GAF and ANTAR domain-containing protein [Pseudarthrobacter sp. MDT3-26]